MSWLPILGAIGSIIGGIGQSQQSSQATAMSQAQLELARRAQDYQFARQAQVDPLFLDLLSRAVGRSRGVPRIAGAYGRNTVPLMAGMRGRSIPLPTPRLIGSPAPGSSTPAGGAIGGAFPPDRDILGR